jgi:hypothetical protein
MRAFPKGSLPRGLVVIGFAWGCGGQGGAADAGVLDDAAELHGFSDTSPAEDGSSGESPDTATTGPTTVETAADGSSTTCIQFGTAGGGGGAECVSTSQETCGDTIYQASCKCPRASCVCFGQTTTVVSFTGCPACPGLSGDAGVTTDDIFALCGFPH